MSNAPKDIRDIDERIEELKKQKEQSSSQNVFFKPSNSSKKGIQYVIEFVSASFLGGSIGYFLDVILNTKPFLMIFLLLCGTVAGFLNLYRLIRKEEAKEDK